MTPERLIEITMAMHWQRANGNWLLAPALGMNTDRSTIRRWKNGSRPIPGDVAAWLEDLKATLDRAPKDSAIDGAGYAMSAERLRDIVENSLGWNSFDLVATLAGDREDRNALWREIISHWFNPGTRAVPAPVAAWLEDMDAVMERAPNVAGRRQIDITSDGSTVFVDLPSGRVGQFGPHSMDIDGERWLDFSHILTMRSDWRRFQAALRGRYNIEVGDEWMPERLKDEGLAV